MIRAGNIFALMTGLLLFVACPDATPEKGQLKSIQKSGILDLESLSTAKNNIRSGDPVFLRAFELLNKEAQLALELTPPSVMDKAFLPPSGDKHDYMSMGPYWWPDTSKPDGLPYIRRDGEVNPERNGYDKLPGAFMSEAVTTLSLMYYFTEDEQYAAKASLLLKTWFLNEATRMNPHLEYGQFIPGRQQGRSVGIIESRNFVFLTDYEPILLKSNSWTDADHTQFKSWMTHFLDWLVKSDLGQQEGRRTNNHGAWYDYQVLALSQYCDQPEPGRSILSKFKTNRILAQIEADGSQPEELARTKSYSYSVFNLTALCSSLILAEHDPDFAGAFDSELPLLVAALEYIRPVLMNEDAWEHKQIVPLEGVLDRLIPIETYIYSKTLDDKYLNDLELLIKKYPESRYILTTGFPIVAKSNTSASDRG